MRLLLIAKNPTNLKVVLGRERFCVDAVRDLDMADFRLASAGYDVVLFDMDGIQDDVAAKVQAWRARGVKSHLMVLGSHLTVSMRVKLLNAGADSYVVKPRHFSEVLARLRGFARRNTEAKETKIRVRDLEIDLESRVARRGGRTIPLTPREFELLRYLARHQGHVVSRAMILEHVYHGRGESNVLNVYIRYLRNKIDKGFGEPLIVTRYGQGYMLRGEQSAPEPTPASFVLAAG